MSHFFFIELFFSMQIPPDIVYKYNILKESTYQKLALPFEPVRLFQKNNSTNKKANTSTTAAKNQQ